jgi:chemotaxis protein MotB
MEDPQFGWQKRLDHADNDSSGNHERWLVSFADLMTLLFALFVVMYASADHERARAVAEAFAGQVGGQDKMAAQPGGTGVLPGGQGVLNAQAAVVTAQANVEQALANNERLKASARVTKTERGFVVSLAEAGFFAPGEADVREDALNLVDDLADSLNGSAPLIRVEGHTDSIPIATERFPSNWELSSARASSVLARLLARGLPSSRLSVAGYASERPVAANDTSEGRAQNRRVDLVILETDK